MVVCVKDNGDTLHNPQNSHNHRARGQPIGYPRLPQLPLTPRILNRLEQRLFALRPPGAAVARKLSNPSFRAATINIGDERGERNGFGLSR